MRTLLTIFVCLFSVSAFAAEAPALIVTRSGYYYVVTDEAGKPVLVPVTNVIRIGDGPPIVIPPGGPPEPPVQTNPTVQLVRGLAGEVNDPAGAKALALVYKTIAEQVDAGKIRPEDAFPAVKLATDQVLAAINAGAKWNGFRTKLGDHITLKLQNGELQHSRDYVKFLGDVATGLESTGASAAALSPEQIRSIIELVLKVIADLLADAVESPV